jgi:RNA polymerase sigma-70 factor (ECF subfamily)
MESDLDRARNGDREALGRLVDSHYDAVYRFCARRIGPEHAKDAAQETFLTAQKRLQSFQGDSSVGTWLFGIAHNHCRNIARKKKMEATQNWLAVGSEQLAEESSITANRQLPTANSENNLIDRHSLREALNALSAEHREVVLLHEVEGLTYVEAAKVLGVPEGTVKSRLHHAFLNLRRAMAPTSSGLIGPEEVTA